MIVAVFAAGIDRQNIHVAVNHYNIIASAAVHTAVEMLGNRQ